MKEININIDDELYRRARQKFDDLELSVSQYVTDYLEGLDTNDAQIEAARMRMAELFRTTTGFEVGIKPTREEMHERGSVH